MENARCLGENALITGWDFSTGGVKCLAFSLEGKTVAEVRLPTDLFTTDGVSELNVMQLEGQARASTRAMAAKLLQLGRIQDWIGGGISATHHTSARIDSHFNQVRRAICWNDHSLATYNAQGLSRLGGQVQAMKITGGPWAIRYSLSHLIKDESVLPISDWKRTWKVLSHGSLAAGYLTGVFDRTSVSCAASTGIMDLRTGEWKKEMLAAIADPQFRELAWRQLPAIVSGDKPLGTMSLELAMEAGVPIATRPMLFPTADDQQAGLAGGGAAEPGQIAIILGNSAVVNSSSGSLPTGANLDVMRLNWGPYLWMRCYNNGAQFLDQVLGPNPDWVGLEKEGRNTPAGCGGRMVLPFANPEPSLGIHSARLQWLGDQGGQPESWGVKYRASLEALAYLAALGVQAHEAAGQKVTRVTVSGGIARSELMCEILASVLNRPIARLESFEGPALGAAVEAFALLENYLRKRENIPVPFTIADAMAQMIRFKSEVRPNPDWTATYAKGLNDFSNRLKP